MSNNENATTKAKQYIGRFAPSPTGPLHLGSLIAATASYLSARSQTNNQWLLRIEDVDTHRCKQSNADCIISTLESYKFQWDGDIIYQSNRSNAYQSALETIRDKTYPCSCTRKQLQAQTNAAAYHFVYPRNCRETLTNPDATQLSIRLKTNEEQVCFNDLIQDGQGNSCQNIQTDVGDFILKRSDGLFAYQLAVVVDDAWQGITHVVRGADLFDNTARQIYLQHCLGYSTPTYSHFPVAVTTNGKKLSKQNQAKEISTTNKRTQLLKALHFLGQNPPALDNFSNLDDLWRWAVQYWDTHAIPKTLTKQL